MTCKIFINPLYDISRIDYHNRWFKLGIQNFNDMNFMCMNGLNYFRKGARQKKENKGKWKVFCQFFKAVCSHE